MPRLRLLFDRPQNSRTKKGPLRNHNDSEKVLLSNDSNFDRNPLMGCNYGSEGGAFLILGGCSFLPKGEERLHEIMC